MTEDGSSSDGVVDPALPLPEAMLNLLDSLRPPEAPRGRPPRGHVRPRALRDFSPVGEDTARDLVGFDLPTSPILSAGGFSRYCALPAGLLDAQSLRDREGVCVYVIYLPQAAQWDGDRVLVEAPRRGPTFLRIHSVVVPVEPDEVGVLHQDRAGGDCTVLDVGGVLVGVSHLSWGTRVDWSSDVSGREWAVTLWNARPPRSTVELLVSDWSSLGPG